MDCSRDKLLFINMIEETSGLLILVKASCCLLTLSEMKTLSPSVRRPL